MLSIPPLWVCVAAAAFLTSGCATDQTPRRSSSSEAEASVYTDHSRTRPGVSSPLAKADQGQAGSPELGERIWLNTEWGVVSEDSNDLTYYMYPPQKQGDLWAATLYYTEAGDDGEALVAWKILLDGPVMGEARLVGKYLFFNRDGDVRQAGHVDANGKLHGAITYYRDSEYFVNEYQHGARHGYSSTYHNNGQLKLRLEYENGEMKACNCPEYDQDGVLESKGEFSRGERNGWTRYYKPSGELTAEIHYVDGRKQGISRYWSDGHLVQETEYQEGDRHGVSRHYWSNGELMEEGNYANNEPSGELHRYDKDGNLTFYQLLDNQGKPIRKKEYSGDGEVKTTTIEETEYGPTTIVEASKDGKVITRDTTSNNWEWRLYERFDESGKLSDRAEFRGNDRIGLHIETIAPDYVHYWQYNDSGELHGESRAVDENGELLWVKTFADDEFHGRYMQRSARTIEEGQYDQGLRTGVWREISIDSGEEVRTFDYSRNWLKDDDAVE